MWLKSCIIDYGTLPGEWVPENCFKTKNSVMSILCNSSIGLSVIILKFTFPTFRNVEREHMSIKVSIMM